MANTHTSINEEFEIELNFKITLTQAHYYGERTEAQMKEIIEEAKAELKNELLYRLEQITYLENLSEIGGYVNFSLDIQKNKSA